VDFDYKRHIYYSSQFKSVVEDAIQFFTETPIYRLPPPGRFIGSGVYALYYAGDFKLYAKIANANRDTCALPIYVGKAVPPGWRTARATGEVTPDLFRRLREHAKSIQQSSNLQVDTFQCRFMILSGVESDLVVPIEAEMIRRYRPLWNTVVNGFGNHDPGKGRYNQARSEWDVLHPGRYWAERLTGESPHLKNIVARIQDFLA
jgi:hypothetical protein